MTKEELKKEAKEELKKDVCSECFDNENDVNDCLGCSYAEGYISGYVTGAEPREKRIAELEAQIEKMKCCYNCKHSRTDYVHCITNKHEKWEMIEK